MPDNGPMDNTPVMRHDQEPQVFIMYRDRDGGWSLDGAHGLDTDLGPTLSILRRMGVEGPFLKLTIATREHYGDPWPTLEDLDAR